MNTPNRRYASRLSRALLCALVVFGQMVGTFGWAASATISVRAKGACGNRPCGCVVVDAESRCCCESPEPAPVVKSCCEEHSKRSCCEKGDAASAEGTHPAKSPKCCSAEPPGKVKAAYKKGWLAEMMAQRCRGEAPPSATTGDPEVPPAPNGIGLFAVEPAERLVPVSDQFLAPHGDPPIPPPRLG